MFILSLKKLFNTYKGLNFTVLSKTHHANIKNGVSERIYTNRTDKCSRLCIQTEPNKKCCLEKKLKSVSIDHWNPINDILGNGSRNKGRFKKAVQGNSHRYFRLL